MCNSLNVKIASKMRKLFTLLKSYENCFDFKNAETFFEHENEDHVIDFLSNAKSLYESLYIFSETKFEILKKLSAEKFDFKLYTKIYESYERIDALRL